jgi:splicing factor 45
LQDVSKLQEDIANDDVNGYYRTLEGQRLARKQQRKKKRKNNEGNYIWTWDDEYDPAHPNDYETYVDSDEQLREQIEWKRKCGGKDEFEEEEEEEEEDSGYRGFAPPKEYEEEKEFIPEPAAHVELDESGDDVYARRMRMAQAAGIKVRPASPRPVQVEPEDENVDGEELGNESEESQKSLPEEKPRSPSFGFGPGQELPPPEIPIPQSTYTISFPPVPSLYSDAPGMQPSQPLPPRQSATISSEPVTYSNATIASSEAVIYETSRPPQDDEPQGSHPGQKNFAARLMSKYGWQKGQSLGSTSTGLVTPLIMKADKDRKGTGTILNRNKVSEDHGPLGKMSRCIVLSNVVGKGEVDEDLVDEIGSECRQKYGEVERVRVIEDGKVDDEVRVYVLFTSELSALRGLNSLNGRLFGGRM